MEEEIKNMVIEMSNEFDEKEGFVTCEFSIHKDDIHKFRYFIKSNNINLKYGKWILTECDACVGYHGEGYVHASIEKHKTVCEIEKSSNYIETIY